MLEIRTSHVWVRAGFTFDLCEVALHSQSGTEFVILYIVSDWVRHTDAHIYENKLDETDMP